MPITRLHSVPEPILITIFSYLNFSQITELKLVCKKWKKFIDRNDDSLYKRFVVERFNRTDKLHTTWQRSYIELVHKEILQKRRNAFQEALILESTI